MNNEVFFFEEVGIYYLLFLILFKRKFRNFDKEVYIVLLINLVCVCKFFVFVRYNLFLDK